MRNFSIVSKGEYNHKQTSDRLEVVRYIVVGKKRRRYLLLDFENKSSERLTGLKLQIDQYDGRGNFLGVKNVSVSGLNEEKGKFVLKEQIQLHSACIDFFVKIAVAEYGNYNYCLNENGIYSVFKKQVKKEEVSQDDIKKIVGEDGRKTSQRKFKAPLLVRICSIIIMLVIVGVSVWQIYDYKNNANRFVLSNIEYEFINSDNVDTSDLVVVGQKGNGKGNLIISNTLEDRKIVAIKENAFKNNNDIVSLVINGNVTIEKNAFAGCKSLKSVTLNNVVNIGANAFDNCSNLKDVKINNCETIGQEAFANCTSLKNLSVVNNVSSKTLNLGDNVLANCGDFDSIVLNQYYLYDEKVDILNGVKSVGSLYLKNYNYAQYEVDDKNINKKIKDLFGATDKVCIEELTIGNSNAIPDDFTMGVEEKLKKVVFEDVKTTIIGNRAFKNCKEMHTFSASGAWTVVGDYAFENTKIESFDANRLKQIGKYAFSGCSRLSTFDLTKNTFLTEINEKAFRDTGSLKMFIPKTVVVLGESAFEDSKIESATFDANFKIEEMITALFKNCKELKSVNIPQSVCTIKNSAFFNCEKLSVITLPSKLELIEDCAFEGCKSLQGIVIPDTVKEIGNCAFKHNVELKLLLIPDTVDVIGEEILSGCEKIEALTTPFLGRYLGYNGTLGYLFGGYWDSVPKSLKQVKVTQDTIIGVNAFANCGTLENVEISNKVKKISSNAFKDCLSLTS